MAVTPAETQSAIDVPLMPWEKQGRTETEDSAEKNLFDILGSDPEFAEDEEDPKKPSEPKSEPDDDDESETGEGETSEDGKSDDESDQGEDDDDSDDEQPDTIDIDGEKVTLEELKKSRLRQADYTRKTQEVAETRKTAEKDTAEARAVRDQYAQHLDELKSVLTKMAPAEPDWDKIRKENPDQFPTLWAEHEMRTKDLAALDAEREKVFKEQRDDLQKQLNVHLVKEHEKLVEAIPEWKDPEKAKAGKKALAEYAVKTYGWTPQDLGNVTDHRLLLVLRKADAYDRIQAKGKNVRDKVKDAPAVLKPGARTSTSDKGAFKSKQLRAARDKARKSGSIKDAAAAIEMLDLD